jgi:hypothetical protein
MGLDIYLSYYKNYQKSKKNEKAFEDFSENLWEVVKQEEGDELCETTKKRVWSVLEKKSKELGLDEYGCDITYKTSIEEHSKLYPEHGFKVGYFRSSYNNSGINGILKDLEIPDLYDIFEPGDEYEFSPDWETALNVVQSSINLLKKDKGYRIETISSNMFAPDDVMENPRHALKVFNKILKENSKSKDSFKWFSNRDGHFYLDSKGLQVHSLLPGKDFMGRPCTYAVYKLKDGNKYYLQALEIVKETIEYVLAQENPQAYYLRWSG